MTHSIVSSTGTFRPMMRLALPVLVEQTLIMLVGLVDTWLAGRMLAGNEHLAAIGLMSYLLWLLPSMFAGVAIGVTAMVSRFVGAGEMTLATRVTNQAFFVGGMLAIIVTFATFVFGDQFVWMLQLRDDAAPLAARYLGTMVPVIPAIMVQQVGIASLRGAGDTLSGFTVMTIVNIVNVIVSVPLVAGIGPMPRLGWDGLAIGTASGHAVGATIVLGLLLCGRAGLWLRLSWMKPDADLIRRLARVGVPGGVDVLAILSCHLWFLSIINALGTASAAAHSLGVRIESLAYLPGTAFQVAAATMVGQFLGARDYRRATQGVLLACLVGGGIMFAAGLVMFFGAWPLTTLFLGENQPQTASTAVHLLRLVAFSMPSLALTMILIGALRGAGDTRWPLAFTFVGLLLVRIPLAYLLAWESVPLPWGYGTISGFGYGVWGAWCAMVVDVVLRSIMVLVRFWQGGWMQSRV